jgi:hypothetical protein
VRVSANPRTHSNEKLRSAEAFTKNVKGTTENVFMVWQRRSGDTRLERKTHGRVIFYGLECALLTPLAFLGASIRRPRSSRVGALTKM